MARAEVQVHEISQRLMLVSFHTMLAVHAALVLSAAWLAFARSRWSVVPAWIAVTACSLTWFGVNSHWEGRILYEVSPHHGLTEADLVVPVLITAALVVRGLRFLGRVARRRRRERIAAGVPTVLGTMWPRA